MKLEHLLGTLFEATVSQQLLQAGEQETAGCVEWLLHINGVSAITVVIDTGRSKRSHKHLYNAKNGVGVIFGAATKKLLFMGVRNKCCSVCLPTPSHQCFKNLSGSSCAMEAY